MHSDYASIVRATINWLNECDYVRKKTGEDFYRTTLFVLSPRSLEVLAAVPESLEAKTSLADKLSDAVKEGAKEAGRSALSKTVGEVIGAVARGFLGTR